jgi:prepilin-type N-terminal cleavage/methylation domain-containing protein
MNFAPSAKNSGFSLIELLIVVSISLLLAVAAIPIYSNLYGGTQLGETEMQVIQNLRLAREDAVSGLNNAAAGVMFLGTSYVIYQGSSYATRNSAYDRTYTLDNALTITTTLTNNEVNFSKIVGNPNNTGTVTIIHSTMGAKVITINRLGAVDVQ